MSPLDKFNKKHYLNIETFRKNGLGVRTPVWFVKEEETLYIITRGKSGKVKRLRNNRQVNIAPCRIDGKPSGAWIPATARKVGDEETIQKVNRLMDKKYGLLKKIFGLGSAHESGTDIVLEIKPAD